MSKNNFIKGAAILGAAGIIVKLIGAIYRIPLTNLIGTEGIGYYQPAYNVYTMLLAISLAGFPTAIARMVSEKIALGNHEGAYQVYRVAIWGLLIVGIVSGVAIFIFAKPIVEFMGYPGSYYSMIALVPALFAVPVLSAYRGYFQGMQSMGPVALSQIFEQIFRVSVGYFLAYTLFDSGLVKAAGGAMFGASAGAIAALVLIFVLFMLKKPSIKREIKKSNSNHIDPVKVVVKNLLIIAIPITIGASISPFMGLADTYLVSSRLSSIGFNTEQITDLFGQLTGMAQTLINFPQAISTAVAVSLVPAVTDAFATNSRRRLNATSEMGVKVSLIIALPCGVGLFMLARPIMGLLFGGVQEAAQITSAGLLEILSISVVFLILVQAFTAILQAVNKQMIPVKNLFVGLVVKVVVSYILIGIPSINIYGAAYSTLAAYIVTAFLNFRAINKQTPVRIRNFTSICVKPLIATAFMAVSVFVTNNLVGMFIKSNTILTLVTISVAVIVYAVALFTTGTITEEDLELIPMGNKLKRFLRKK